jgi:SAM-dependent MidA family methyltransferase
MTAAEGLVRAAIERRGPIGFDEVMAIALYDAEHGFYATGGRAGRRGDFLTSPEVGPLFGAVVASALDRWWEELGEPEVFSVVEAGAGPGTLARAVLAADPRCRGALRYVLVEGSPMQRAHHREHLDLELPEQAFASPPEPDEEIELATPPAPPGPIVVSLPALPRLPGPCVVLANELLDNLPFGLLEWHDGAWHEVRVGLERGRLAEVLVPAPAEHPLASEGARVPTQRAAASWVREARTLAGHRGRVVAIDYCSTTEELASRPWTEWVRTYRGHARGSHPLAELGRQDITCEVAVDQLPPATRAVTQAEWLRQHGIDALVEAGRATWRERAHLGDLAAVRARSRVTEADALLDPAGLGAFQVLEWDGLT